MQSRTAGEFKASAVGAYERGERSLSIERLIRLADVYRTTPSAIVGDEPEIDLPALHAEERAASPSLGEAEILSIARFSTYVRLKRGAPPEVVIDVRRSDRDLLAILLGRDETAVEELLSRLGLHAGVHQTSRQPSRPL